ncbi:MAG: helix-turn-helix transcriptional regulator [Mangrovicoccus sp.]|nr:helix-turn-helix transcriptional regulator [Mangrovicoccus sp.]
MLIDARNWPELCREYRRRHGLKQEAMAQDFGVGQSLVSRWERGNREPPLSVKRAIQNDLIEAGSAGLDLSLQMLLNQSSSAVAIWDQKVILRGCSPRFERELRQTFDYDDLIGRSEKDFLQGHNLARKHIEILTACGFFQGKIAMATAQYKPILRKARSDLGGSITTSIFPVMLSPKDPAMLCIYDHDALVDDTDVLEGLEINWIEAHSGMVGSAHTQVGMLE